MHPGGGSEILQASFDLATGGAAGANGQQAGGRRHGGHAPVLFWSALPETDQAGYQHPWHPQLGTHGLAPLRCAGLLPRRQELRLHTHP